MSRRTNELVISLAEAGIVDAIGRSVHVLWRDADTSWDSWAAGRLAAALGAAFHRALQDLCPEYDADELIVDILLPDGESGLIRVWLTEQTIGGGGILQEALRRVGDRPRRFFDLVAAAAEPSLDETVDIELARVVREAAGDTPVAAAIDVVRDANTHAERSRAFEGFLAALQDAGAFVCHPVVSALSVRLLRPGSSPRIDKALDGLITRWDALEHQLEIDIDLRSFADLHARTDEFDRSTGLAPPPDDPVGWRAGQIAGLLWQRGSAVSAQALRAPNPFTVLPPPDLLLLRSCLASRVEPVPVGRLDMIVAPNGRLGRDGDAEIEASHREAVELRRDLLRAAASPIEAGPLLHYPRVDGVSRDVRGLRARLVLDLVGE